jgi:hypothetical protein
MEAIASKISSFVAAILSSPKLRYYAPHTKHARLPGIIPDRTAATDFLIRRSLTEFTKTKN